MAGDTGRGDGPESGRRDALALLARVERSVLAKAWADWDHPPAIETLRKPEFGLVMVRGRVGGSGSAFNLGEATVTRAAVRLPAGEIGFGQVLGRERERAWLVAVFDALWQTAARARVEERVLSPARTWLEEARQLTGRQTAATRVNFFTLVRGED